VISPEEWLQGEAARRRIADLDTDFDGKISRAEWIAKYGNDRMYEAYDVDGDGVISADEWLKGEKAQNLYQATDIDGDHKLSRDEWVMKFGDDEMFDMYDLDGDGVIDAEEFLKGEKALQHYQDLDLDGDGVVSRAEWIMKFGNDKLYDAYDRDGDGNISPEEWLKGEQAVMAFEGIDRDGNEKLSRDEWIVKYGNDDKFSQYDKDGDGVISAEEWMIAQKNREDPNRFRYGVKGWQSETETMVPGEMGSFVVDCGSGHSSVMLYQTGVKKTGWGRTKARVDNATLLEDAAETDLLEPPQLAYKFDELPILVQALESGGTLEWCGLLKEHTESDCPIEIAATAGVRQALRDGTITNNDIEAFRRLIKTEFDDRATFKILSGEDESVAEHRAVTLCSRWSNVVAPGGGAVLLASAGGVSMQVSTATGRHLSITSDSFEGTDLVRDSGVSAGLQEWRNIVHENLRRGTVGTGIGGSRMGGGSQLKGDFVCIELLAWVASEVGVPTGTWITRSSFSAKCRDFIDRAEAKLVDIEQEAGLPHTERYPCFVISYTQQVEVTLTTLFSSDAMFYADHEGWEPLCPDWTLGLFLAQCERQFNTKQVALRDFEDVRTMQNVNKMRSRDNY